MRLELQRESERNGIQLALPRTVAQFQITFITEIVLSVSRLLKTPNNPNANFFWGKLTLF
jgi:hypothetical protein